MIPETEAHEDQAVPSTLHAGLSLVVLILFPNRKKYLEVASSQPGAEVSRFKICTLPKRSPK